MFSYYAFPPRVKQCLANTVLLTKRLHREPALLMLRNQLLPIFQSTDRCFAAHLSNIRFLAPFRHWGLQAAYHILSLRVQVILRVWRAVARTGYLVIGSKQDRERRWRDRNGRTAKPIGFRRGSSASCCPGQHEVSLCHWPC